MEFMGELSARNLSNSRQREKAGIYASIRSTSGQINIK